jgi:Leucine-rich repeat (LRR) protein
MSCKSGHIDSLKLSGLNITSISSSITEMTRLSTLNLASNKLTELPDLTDLSSLRSVYLMRNALTNITGVFDISVLSYLNINNNELLEIPPEFGNSSLGALFFENNNVPTIPTEYAASKLQQLKLHGNMLRCFEVRKLNVAIFSSECVQSRQNSESSLAPLPLDDSTPIKTQTKLDALEIASIVLAVITVCCIIVGSVLFVRYRKQSIKPSPSV